MTQFLTPLPSVLWICLSERILAPRHFVSLRKKQPAIAIRAVDGEAMLIAIVSSEMTWRRTVFHGQCHFDLCCVVEIPKSIVLEELSIDVLESRKILHS